MGHLRPQTRPPGLLVLRIPILIATKLEQAWYTPVPLLHSVAVRKVPSALDLQALLPLARIQCSFLVKRQYSRRTPATEPEVMVVLTVFFVL